MQFSAKLMSTPVLALKSVRRFLINRKAIIVLITARATTAIMKFKKRKNNFEKKKRWKKKNTKINNRLSSIKKLCLRLRAMTAKITTKLKKASGKKTLTIKL